MRMINRWNKSSREAMDAPSVSCAAGACVPAHGQPAQEPGLCPGLSWAHRVAKFRDASKQHQHPFCLRMILSFLSLCYNTHFVL